MTTLAPTPGQTVGPFFGFALPYDAGSELVPPTRPDAVRLHGRVLDGHGDPVPDALLELWQPGPDGRVVQRQGSFARDSYTFTGWGRAATDRTGRYRFSTLRPGGTPPYFAITVLARGLLDRLFTRAYLPGTLDDRLPDVPAERRHTIVAEADDRGFVFDIRLQGEDETVFFSYTQD
ncbi:protocatechuate 3,4-dioxygenase subunit alpha [Nocardioides sp. YIM 152315]|uniref:protocatechuate 3,4-dioxygenase subunit alpha n=1 Tax=Nocardioides sp. YIM 152315 TaxID=3031760 RepID=UPI0023DAA244|nr:protocatechuate 3,4-dioxygenase subunit alpha [Nocardioides sp. YIM 152315]MDF1605332.1 protocatechuate 3,4-dioxygenase subunit alpha [Nocardioides sp. YIM 152315]